MSHVTILIFSNWSFPTKRKNLLWNFLYRTGSFIRSCKKFQRRFWLCAKMLTKMVTWLIWSGSGKICAGIIFIGSAPDLFSGRLQALGVGRAIFLLFLLLVLHVLALLAAAGGHLLVLLLLGLGLLPGSGILEENNAYFNLSYTHSSKFPFIETHFGPIHRKFVT